MDFIIFTLIMAAIIFILFLIAPYLIVAGIVIWLIGVIARYIRNEKGTTDNTSNTTEEYTYTKQSDNPNVIDVEYTEHEEEE